VSEASKAAEEDLLILNERQAWQLLDLERMLGRGAWLTHGRMLTGLGCYHCVLNGGLFGKSPVNYAGDFINNYDFEPIELSESSPTEVPFAVSAAFLDIVSEWINCDELFAFLRHLPGPDIRSYDAIQRLQHRALELLVRAVDFRFWDYSTGICQYADLSIDIHRLLVSEISISPWFQTCLARWYEPYGDKVVGLLRALADREAKSSRRHAHDVLDWSERIAAVASLTLLATGHGTRSGDQHVSAFPTVASG
jgi:hypothetical protein